jgi:iron complex transport system substrate-binding protein
VDPPYNDRMRVASLLPAATEIVAALGMVDALVGVSHECDYPAVVAGKPRVTNCTIHGNGLTSASTDAWVKEQLATNGSLYTIDEEQLRTLAVDVILTQGLCDVCAPSLESVAAVAARLPGPPRVVNLEPQSLGDIFDNIRTCAVALGVGPRGDAVVGGLEHRIATVRAAVAGAPVRRCVVLEWLAPLFANGHWGPELTTLAGGHDPVGQLHRDAIEVSWDAVRAAAPEVLILACCGYDIGRTLADVPLLRALPGFSELPAVRNAAVWAVDGAAYFSRPGPRIVDSLEILARLIHPDRFADPVADDAARRVRLD